MPQEAKMSDITRQVGSSISALTKEFEVITNNLANVSTAGYKRRANAFTKVLEQHMAQGQSPVGEIRVDSSYDFSQGALTQTGRSLDMAIYGNGFFVVETPDGPVYTRNGNFHLNQNGQLADGLGRLIQGQAGPINLPGDVEVSQVLISQEGVVSFDGNEAGQLNIVDFDGNENQLVPCGHGSFRVTGDAQPGPAANAVVMQGYQEASNVRMMEELVNMIMVSRLYEANMKMISGTAEASRSLMSVAMG